MSRFRLTNNIDCDTLRAYTVRSTTIKLENDGVLDVNNSPLINVSEIQFSNGVSFDGSNAKIDVSNATFLSISSTLVRSETLSCTDISATSATTTTLSGDTGVLNSVNTSRVQISGIVMEGDSNILKITRNGSPAFLDANISTNVSNVNASNLYVDNLSAIDIECVTVNCSSITAINGQYISISSTNLSSNSVDCDAISSNTVTSSIISNVSAIEFQNGVVIRAAQGQNSIDLGVLNNAAAPAGSFSICWGGENSSSGSKSTCGGRRNTASGECSTCFGFQNRCGGANALVCGRDNIVNGANSFCAGQGNTILGKNSLGAGLACSSQGSLTMTVGDHLMTSGYGEICVGRYNAIIPATSSSWVNSDPLISVGIGTGESDRRNAVTILKNGQIGVGKHTNISGAVDISGDLSVEGNVFADNIYGSFSGTVENSQNSENIFIGFFPNFEEYVVPLIARQEGFQSLYAPQSGGIRFSPHLDSVVFGDASSSAPGLTATAFGSGTTASGENSVAFGKNTNASGSQSSAFGESTVANGESSMALGFHTRANSLASFSCGRYNYYYDKDASLNPTTWQEADPIFEVGVGTDLSNLKNALTVLKNGRVGINTPTPTTNLDVSGTINANNLHLDTSSSKVDIGEYTIQTLYKSASDAVTQVFAGDISGLTHVFGTVKVNVLEASGDYVFREFRWFRAPGEDLSSALTNVSLSGTVVCDISSNSSQIYLVVNSGSIVKGYNSFM